MKKYFTKEYIFKVRATAYRHKEIGKFMKLVDTKLTNDMPVKRYATSDVDIEFYINHKGKERLK